MKKMLKLDPRAFGAQGDGVQSDTVALQKCIDACSENGGGAIALEGGTFLSGTLYLKDNITLCIEKGACLKAVPNPDEFHYANHSYRSRMDVVPWRIFLYAEGKENITICGEGTFEGGGGNYDLFPSYTDNDPIRPYGLFFVGCKNITVKGIHLRNSSFWMQRYLYCNHVRLEDLDVWNHPEMDERYKGEWPCQNSDGIDIDSCQNVFISNCCIDSGDDAICIKSEGEDPSENIVITNCIVATHASGIKFGTGSVGGFRNIQVSNCVIRRSEATKMTHCCGSLGGLAGIDLATVDGGLMENITFTNLSIDGVDSPIHIQVGNRQSGTFKTQGYGDSEIDSSLDATHKNIARISGVSQVRGVVLSQISISNPGKYACAIHGYEGNKIEDVVLRDIRIQYSTPGTEEDRNFKKDWAATSGYPNPRQTTEVYGFYIGEVDHILLDHITLIPAAGEVREAMAYDQVENLIERDIVIKKQ